MPSPALLALLDDGGGAAIALLLVGAAIYFLPSIIGAGKRNSGAIFALNLLLGWTLIGWVVALVWALTQDVKQTVIVNTPAIPAISGPSGSPLLCAHCGKYSLPGSGFCATCGQQFARR